MTCELAKQLLGLISSPANWISPSQALWPSTQKLQMAFRPLKPSQEVAGSAKEELPGCARQGPSDQKRGQKTRDPAAMGQGLWRNTVPGANQSWPAGDKGPVGKSPASEPTVWIWPFRHKSVQKRGPFVLLFLLLLTLSLFSQGSGVVFQASMLRGSSSLVRLPGFAF